jgi:hypothetical protein
MVALLAGCHGPGASQATLPIEPGGLPVVRATLDGRPLRLLIDSGASAPIVAPALLGIAAEAWTTVDSLCLGAFCFPDARVFARDSPFSSAEPGAINGLVGMSLLQGLALELDHGETLTVSTERRGCAGDAQPLSFESEGRPQISSSFDDGPRSPILLDTGALYTLLSAQTAASATYLAAAAVSTGACSINGCAEKGSFVSMVKRVCAGATCLSDVPVKYPAWDALGNSFLKSFRTVIDLAGRRITFCQ